MQVLVCESSITMDAAGVPSCVSGWMVADPASLYSGLTISDFQYLSGWALVVLITAFGIKIIRKQMGF